VPLVENPVDPTTGNTSQTIISFAFEINKPPNSKQNILTLTTTHTCNMKMPDLKWMQTD